MVHFFYDKSLHNPNALQNIGIIDRVTRVIVGGAMVGAWFVYPIASVSMWFALLPLLGVFPLITGMLGWCPVYGMLRTKSCGSDDRNSCGTFPDQLDHLINPH